MVRKDVHYHRNAVIRQMMNMLRQGIQPLPTPPRLDRRTGDVLIRPSIFIDVCRLFGGVGAVRAAIDARAARKAAAAAAQAGPAAAQAAEERPTPGRRRRHQVEDDNAGPSAPPPRRSRRHQS